jgi:hypothetical protein
MADSLVDFAFLIVVSTPVLILAFLWAVLARDRSPRWIYMGSKWSTIVLFVPWLVLAMGLVSDMASGS